MNEKNLNQHLLIIGVILVAGAAALYPPERKLQGGLDINGGFSVIFEIDDHGLEDQPDLAEQMKLQLQRRVDPTGVSGIVWRVHGRNRLEVQMPLPPVNATELRDRYLNLLDQLLASNLRRSEIEAACRQAEPERAAALDQLAQRADVPLADLRLAAQRYDEYLAALAAVETGRTAPAEPPAAESKPADGAADETSTQPAASAPAPNVQRELDMALRDATERLDDAIEQVLSHNLDEHRFRDALELDEKSPIRKNTIDQIKAEHPHLAKGPGGEPGLIDQVIEAHNRWRPVRGHLDGPADLRRLLRGAGVLDFRILAEPTQENPTQWDRYREQLAKNGPRFQPGDTARWFKIDQPLSFFHLRSPADLVDFKPIFSGVVAEKYNDQWYALAMTGGDHEMKGDAQRSWQLKGAGRSRDRSGRPSVAFEFDARGGDLFRELTRKNVGKQLCIFVDDIAYSHATIHEAIGKRGEISGDFSTEKVNYLINTMQAGALPARLKDTPVSERVIGSSLGRENLQRALLCGMIGVGLTIGFMIFIYGWAGTIAGFATLMNLFLLLAAMAFIEARFTLDGIAGVILAIGMSVDSNVLIYERMREERDRGSSLRIVIKNGYDKALTTIIDSNVTTLLVCLIIYYAGSEEIKGFGLTLGWGLALNLFAAVFVTRVIFALLVKYRILKDIKFRRVIGEPSFDWVRHSRLAIPVGLVVMVLGLGVVWSRGGDALDVEFRGGVSAEMDVNPEAGLNDRSISQKIAEVGRSIRESARRLGEAAVRPVVGDASLFEVTAPGVPAARLAALIAEPLEETSVPVPGEPGAKQSLLVRGGVQTAGESVVRVRVTAGATADSLQQVIRGIADRAVSEGDNFAQANVSKVLSSGAGDRSSTWNVTTTVTNKQLVQHGLVSALGADLQIEPKIDYTFVGEREHPFQITDRRLEAVIPNLPPGAGADLTDYLGGAAIYMTGLNPPQTIEALTERLRSTRLQPGYQNEPWRKFEVIGVERARTDGQLASDSKARPLYTGIVIAVYDAYHAPDQNLEAWESQFADRELALAKAALDTEQTLQKVSQFKPQIAGQAQTQAIVAMVLSWAMMIGYMWLRFGQPIFGVAGVLALIFDVLVALAFVGFAGWIALAGLGQFILIEDFKINMPVVAAFLTIIGYSVNDKIVNFDRIRENRGRAGVLTPEIVNRSLNQTLARTLLTSSTTIGVLIVLYIFGGSSIRGFNFCMLVGILVGTYSSLAMAAPMLLFGQRFEAARERRSAVATA